MRSIVKVDVARLIGWPQSIGDRISLLLETRTRDEAIEQAIELFDCPLARQTFELRDQRIEYLEQLHLREEPVLHQYLNVFDTIRAYDVPRHYKTDLVDTSYYSLINLEKKRTAIRDQFKGWIAREEEPEVSVELWDSTRELLNIWYKNLSEKHIDLTNEQEYEIKMNILQQQENHRIVP